MYPWNVPISVLSCLHFVLRLDSFGVVACASWARRKDRRAWSHARGSLRAVRRERPSVAASRRGGVTVVAVKSAPALPNGWTGGSRAAVFLSGPGVEALMSSFP
eukprot:1648683-Prymnesium_polylepis.1